MLEEGLIIGKNEREIVKLGAEYKLKLAASRTHKKHRLPKITSKKPSASYV